MYDITNHDMEFHLLRLFFAIEHSALLTSTEQVVIFGQQSGSKMATRP
jgi:hypothetical protein